MAGAGDRKRPDGTLYDALKMPRGYWEAKDGDDDLEAEIRRKIERRYPLTNTIFEDTRRAVLYQNERRVAEADMARPAELGALLAQFFAHTRAQIAQFYAAVREFQQRIPDLACGTGSNIWAWVSVSSGAAWARPGTATRRPGVHRSDAPIEARLLRELDTHSPFDHWRVLSAHPTRDGGQNARMGGRANTRRAQCA